MPLPQQTINGNKTAQTATTGGAPMLCAAMPAGTAPSALRTDSISRFSRSSRGRARVTRGRRARHQSPGAGEPERQPCVERRQQPVGQLGALARHPRAREQPKLTKRGRESLSCRLRSGPARAGHYHYGPTRPPRLSDPPAPPAPPAPAAPPRPLPAYPPSPARKYHTTCLRPCARARALASILRENSSASLLATKKLLTDQARDEIDAQIQEAVRSNASIRETADFREGISSFLEKRKPRWSSQ